MLTQLLLPLVAATLFIVFVWLVWRRRDAHARARDDFTQFMTLINDWSEKFGDYQLTGHAIVALGAHDDRLLLAAHTPEPTWIGSLGDRHYLAEYKRCMTRHQALVSDANNGESARQAKDLALAIEELSSQVDRPNK